MANGANKTENTNKEIKAILKYSDDSLYLSATNSIE